MIFRAMVEAYPHGRPERERSERVAFIEAVNRDDAKKRLVALVSLTWQVPVESVQICNLEPEFELRGSPLAEGLPPGQAMFVIGYGPERAIFVNGAGPCGFPLFFLSSEQERVMSTFLSLPREYIEITSL